VHDREIEDRLRAVLRAEGDGLQVSITTQELERRLTIRRRDRMGRRVGLVAAALGIVAVGSLVVTAAPWVRGPGSAVGGAPDSSMVAGSPSATAASSPSSAPEATGSTAAAGCEPVDPTASDNPPALVAGVIPGDSIGYGGAVIGSEWNGTTMGSAGSWDVPVELEPIVVGPDADAIEVAADVCLTNVASEAFLTNRNADSTAPGSIKLATLQGIGTRVVDLEPPSTGTWLVRVRASFATGDGSPAWSETIFRMNVLFDAPELTMSQGAGMDHRTVAARCPAYDLASGATVADPCAAPYQPITDVEPLAVYGGPAGGTNGIDFVLAQSDLPEWELNVVRVTAVEADLVGAGSFAPEYSVAFIEDIGTSRVEVPIALDPGTWILRVSLTASRGGDSYGATYDFPYFVGQ
jgi:hypothetical protein